MKSVISHQEDYLKRDWAAYLGEAPKMTLIEKREREERIMKNIKTLYDYYHRMWI